MFKLSSHFHKSGTKFSFIFIGLSNFVFAPGSATGQDVPPISPQRPLPAQAPSSRLVPELKMTEAVSQQASKLEPSSSSERRSYLAWLWSTKKEGAARPGDVNTQVDLFAEAKETLARIIGFKKHSQELLAMLQELKILLIRTEKAHGVFGNYYTNARPGANILSSLDKNVLIPMREAQMLSIKIKCIVERIVVERSVEAIKKKVVDRSEQEIFSQEANVLEVVAELLRAKYQDLCETLIPQFASYLKKESVENPYGLLSQANWSFVTSWTNLINKLSDFLQPAGSKKAKDKTVPNNSSLAGLSPAPTSRVGSPVTAEAFSSLVAVPTINQQAEQPAVPLAAPVSNMEAPLPACSSPNATSSGSGLALPALNLPLGNLPTLPFSATQSSWAGTSNIAPKRTRQHEPKTFQSLVSDNVPAEEGLQQDVKTLQPAAAPSALSESNSSNKSKLPYFAMALVVIAGGIVWKGKSLFKTQCSRQNLAKLPSMFKSCCAALAAEFSAKAKGTQAKA